MELQYLLVFGFVKNQSIPYLYFSASAALCVAFCCLECCTCSHALRMCFWNMK